MELLEKVKSFLAYRDLKKESADAKRAKKNISIEKAKNIGVLYSITDEQTYRSIFSFLKSLKTEQRSVIALGYLNDKKIPTFLTQGVYNSIITQKDLNWYGKPVNQYVKNFFRENFDIFLNISMEDYYPLIYISALSNATFKVGKFNEKYTNYYDLMIKAEPGISQQEYIETMIHYINVINQKSHDE